MFYQYLIDIGTLFDICSIINFKVTLYEKH